MNVDFDPFVAKDTRLYETISTKYDITMKFQFMELFSCILGFN